jgi:hypothetical protein
MCLCVMKFHVFTVTSSIIMDHKQLVDHDDDDEDMIVDDSSMLKENNAVKIGGNKDKVVSIRKVGGKNVFTTSFHEEKRFTHNATQGQRSQRFGENFSQ